MDLFDNQAPAYQPLAARMRPQTLDQYRGQEHLLGPGKPLARALAAGQMHSMVLWGPPGVGKTTLARLIAARIDAHLEVLSAVLSGVKDIRQAVERARMARQQGRMTLLFVDEVHRFNKSQQDAFLPHIEDGTFVFIGATTENPSFELNNALLSRARVYLLKPLAESALRALLQEALSDQERGLGARLLSFDEGAVAALVAAADGDARRLLNLLEVAADLVEDGACLDEAVLDEVLVGLPRRFDKRGDDFYDQLSALHKSVRGSSPDGALYWFARMLDGGADPLVVARRLLAIASEDIGNADPRALPLCVAAWDTYHRLGGEDGTRAIAQALVYCASAAKSNALYRAFKAARADVAATGSLPVPAHLRNAPTTLMKELGYGAEYRYAHDEPEAYAAGECYFPDTLEPRCYYQPEPRGLEIRIGEKLQHLRALDRASAQQRRDFGSPSDEG